MARINIPIDVLTSRLNFSDRFNSIRSQSLASRFSNLKPVSEFLDLKRLSKPHDFADVQSRVNYNLGYFSSNYAVVFVMLCIYSLLTNLWLLFDIVFVVMGMWAIGKMNGSDLVVGTFRATTSQLYTGLACVAIPVAIFSAPISTALWLVGATGVTVLECFFRGGGLGGRPRTPYDAPFWGRPPGARLGRRNNRAWEKPQSWEFNDRFEELETDDDGYHGVDLDPNYPQKRFVSDELRFTGIDLGGGRGSNLRQRRDYDDDLTPSEDDDYDGNYGLVRRQAPQMSLKEKEDMLVARALERIARARALGKTNVKLSQAEIDALERSERNKSSSRTSAVPKSAPRSKKAVQTKPKPTEKKKSKNDKSASNSPKVKAIEARSRGKSTSSLNRDTDNDDSLISYPIPSDRNYGYDDAGYGSYASGSRPRGDSRVGSRNSSAHSLRQLQALPPQYQHPYYANRYFTDAPYQNRPPSASRSSRPDPSDPNWEPRARSKTVVNVPLDQIPYQAGTGRAPRFEPSDPRYASPARRVTSGPAVVQTQPRFRRPPDELFLPEHPQQPEVMQYMVAPDEEDDEDDDDDEDEDVDEDTDDNSEDQGVQVNVEERSAGGYAIQTRSAATKRTNGNKAMGKAGKKGR